MTYAGEEYDFCCDGCADVFRVEPEHCLSQIRDNVVCPVCLAETPAARTVTVQINGRTRLENS